MRKSLLLLILAISTTFVYSQTENKKAEQYLKERGSIEFTFTANNLKEVKALSNIISFDHAQDPSNLLKINAIANQKEFDKFLEFKLPYTVDSEKNEKKAGVQMYDPSIHGDRSTNNRAYTLSFPLNAYPTFAQYASQMNDFATDHSSIAQLVNIGSSVNGRDLLFIKLSDNVSTHEQEPRILLTSSMHGDEIAGYPMMLSLIDYLIEVYNNPAHSRYTEIKNLIDNSEIWINPMANPDGTFFGDWTNYADVSGARRANANNIDLNRNYPDPRVGPNPDGNSYQVETTAFMNMANTYHFVLAANFHGGAEVFNYPWDTWTVAQGRHVDDDWYNLIVASQYATHAQNDGPTGYFDDNYDSNAMSGVTHGATWYQVAGGRQDYMNYDHQCRESTIELSNTKLIPANQIQNHWDYNRNALIDLIKQGTYGFTGLVKDANTLNPIQAKVTIVGRDNITNSRGSWVNTELPIGDFYRPIEAGTYDILFEADCYQPKTIYSQVITDGTTINLGDVFLTPVSPSVPNSLTASSITTTSATISWSATSGGTSYDVRYRVMGSSTWTNTTSNTTSLDLTGLSINTTYEYEVRGVCGSTSSAYSTTANFTTLAVSYCTSNGNSNYNTGVTRVRFANIDKIDTNNTNNNGYDDFTSEGGTSTTTVIQGSTHKLRVNVNTDGPYTVHAFAWIDFNADGDFNDANETYDLGDVNNVSNGLTSIRPDITIPASAAIGTTRMRVAARYNSNPSACGVGYDGEVEDYKITIEAVLDVDSNTQELDRINVYPNPVTDKIFISLPNSVELIDYKISNIIGQVVLSKKFENNSQIDVSSINSGVYMLSLNTDKGKVIKKIVIQ